MSIQANFVAVPISVALYHQILSRHAHPSALIEDVVSDFLDRTTEDHEALQRAPQNGLRWEHIFLPEGTKLRTKHHGEQKYAEVKGDSIVYNKQKFSSVGTAINAMRGHTSNNAWLVTELQRPSDTEWLEASKIRRLRGSL